MYKILISSTDVMMYQFLLPHVQYLSENGFEVDVACSYAEGYQNEGYHQYISEHLPSQSTFFSVALQRSPFSVKNLRGLKELQKIISGKKYDLIWTNEPVMGVMTRLAAQKARRAHTQVFYLVHGYHFFEGAPKRNWIYYPVEKVMSHYCDAMGMINWEDYHFTQKHMPTKKVFHIDGIGFDSSKFIRSQEDRDSRREAKRKELGITKDEILLLSVGELQGRKNHEPVLRALPSVEKNIKYVICGWGELKDYLQNLAAELGVADRFSLLGHRYDIPDILLAADIFVHPSQREGLGIAALEAMASGLPVVASNVQGLKDFITNGENGYVLSPNDVDGYAKAINKLVCDKGLRERVGITNRKSVEKYDIRKSRVQMLQILTGLLQNKETGCKL